MKTGIELIAEERERQVSVEGWTAEHDDEHNGNQIAMAAACYATGLRTKVHVTVNDCNCRSAGECTHYFGTDKWVDAWPWEKKWDKREKHDRLKQLTIAGALIAAEIDRLNRKRELTNLPPATSACSELDATDGARKS